MIFALQIKIWLTFCCQYQSQTLMSMLLGGGQYIITHFLGQILVCAYTICHHGQILILCTIPSRSPYLPSHVWGGPLRSVGWSRRALARMIICVRGWWLGILVSWVWRWTAYGGEVPVMELWGVWSASSLPLLPGSLWPGVVAPVGVPSVGWMDQNLSL